MRRPLPCLLFQSFFYDMYCTHVQYLLRLLHGVPQSNFPLVPPDEQCPGHTGDCGPRRSKGLTRVMTSFFSYVLTFVWLSLLNHWEQGVETGEERGWEVCSSGDNSKLLKDRLKGHYLPNWQIENIQINHLRSIPVILCCEAEGNFWVWQNVTWLCSFRCDLLLYKETASFKLVLDQKPISTNEKLASRSETFCVHLKGQCHEKSCQTVALGRWIGP